MMTTKRSFRLTASALLASICCLLPPLALAQGQALLAADAEVTLLHGGFGFTEGPAADADGNVYFTDIPANRIYRWTLTGELELFRENSNATNGLFFDRQWQLYGCEGGAGRITRMNAEGEVTVVIDRHDGAPFNSPNDLWIDADGGIYFTDPRYGDESNLPQPGYYVYYLAPGADAAQAVITDLVKPNGVIGTADGSILYVADHLGRRTLAYDIESPGQLSAPRVIAEQGADGMTLDTEGNLYLTPMTGARDVTVYSPQGELLTSIEFPEVPANLTFGGAQRDVLFATARAGLYAIPMLVRGMY